MSISVLKFGGEILETPEKLARLTSVISRAVSDDEQLILCHGAGPQISAAMKHANIEPAFVKGQRVTTEQTLRLTCAVQLADVNRSLVSGLVSAGIKAVGLGGFNAGLIKVRKREPDLGFVGEILSINVELLRSLSAGGYLPVVVPIGIDSSGINYNINADVAAAELAVSLKASCLVMLTGVDGLYRDFEDKTSLVKQMRLSELEEFLSSGAAHSGMIPKLQSIAHALENGVSHAHIVSGNSPSRILGAISNNLEMGSSFGL